MKKLKIAFVTNNYKPYSGGVVSSIDTFAKELINLGHEVYIITLDFKNYQIAETSNIIRLNCPIKFFYNKLPVSLPIGATLQIIKILKNLKIDIIHSHHPFLLGKAALYAAKSLKKPIIFTHHTMYQHYAHNTPIPPSISKPIIENLALYYCNNVNAIIAPSDSTKQYLLNNNIKTTVHVLASGINDIFVQQKTNYLISSKVKLLTVSRFSKEKNITSLINVFANMDQTKYDFTIVGFGPEEQNLKTLAANLNIKFVIAPTKIKLAEIYKNSDIFLFASQSETQGIVLAEAMASGLPIIALEGPGQNDIIKNGINGFLVKKANEIPEKIAATLDNYKSMSLQAQKTGLEYTPYRKTQELLGIYKNLL